MRFHGRQGRAALPPADRKTARRRTFLTLDCVLLAATLLFMWGNSLQSPERSQAESGRVLKAVRPLLELALGEGNVTEHLVRKLAHFTEYTALGLELTALAMLRRRRGWQSAVNCLSAGLAAAVTDETLQLFSGRGSQVQDVLLDFSGAALGIMLPLLIRRFAAGRRPVPAGCRELDPAPPSGGAAGGAGGEKDG